MDASLHAQRGGEIPISELIFVHWWLRGPTSPEMATNGTWRLFETHSLSANGAKQIFSGITRAEFRQVKFTYNRLQQTTKAFLFKKRECGD